MTEHEPDSNPVISIIVPVYNVAEFVVDCLDSIAAQVFDARFEVIVIDDCSTDDSAGLIRNWMKSGPDHFKCSSNESNSGVSVTRNRGLELARGAYFMFVDPDDLLPPKALQLLHAAAETHGVDIVKGNNDVFGESREGSAGYNVDRSQRVDGDAVLTTLYEHEKVRGHPWGKLFRRATLGQHRFPVGVRMAQDLLYNCEVFAAARSLYLLDQTVYRYRNRETGSTGRKYHSGAYQDWLDSVEKTGHFAHNQAQRRAHKKLLVRTLTQLVRESRGLNREQAVSVLQTIEQRCQRWQVSWPILLWRDRLDPASLLRYLKMRLALRKVRRIATHGPVESA